MNDISKHKQEFLRAITKAKAIANETSPRSNKKLVPAHGWIATILSQKLGKGFCVKSLGWKNGKEKKFDGKYFSKTTDVLVEKNGTPVGIVNFKFILSNYAQNARNYFENMLGETANIRRQYCPLAQIIVLPKDIPYYAKDGTQTRIERLNSKKLEQYIKLIKDKDFPHRPDILTIVILDFAQKEARFCSDDKDMDLENEGRAFLKKDLSLDNFIKKFPLLCRLATE